MSDVNDRAAGLDEAADYCRDHSNTAYELAKEYHQDKDWVQAEYFEARGITLLRAAVEFRERAHRLRAETGTTHE